MTTEDPDVERAEMLARWEGAAAGWGRRADRVRDMGMPVSAWMIDHLALQPGQRVLELAAGPGDTGFLAAELIKPGGTLISSDATEAMLEIARERARQMGIDNVEFRQLELEWIDLHDRQRRRDPVPLGGHADPRPAGRGPGDAARAAPRRSGRARGLGRVEAEPVGDDPGARARRARSHRARPTQTPQECSRWRRRARSPSCSKERALSTSRSTRSSFPGATRTLTPTSTSSSTSRACSRRSSASSPRMSRLEVRRRIGELLSEFATDDGSIRVPGQTLVAAANA